MGGGGAAECIFLQIFQEEKKDNQSWWSGLRDALKPGSGGDLPDEIIPLISEVPSANERSRSASVQSSPASTAIEGEESALKSPKKGESSVLSPRASNRSPDQSAGIAAEPSAPGSASRSASRVSGGVVSSCSGSPQYLISDEDE